MIVRREADHLLLVPQREHAELAARLAGRLLDVPAPRDLFVQAVREHDNGWDEYDASPLLDPSTGAPYSYRDTPPGPYLDVWKRGILRALELHPHVGLLVSLHGSRFFRDAKTPDHEAFYRFERLRQHEILRRLGHEDPGPFLPTSVRLQSQSLAFLDGLSLFICDAWESRWRSVVRDEQVAVARGPDGTVTVAPWPFLGDAAQVEIHASRLAEPRYEDEAALHAAVRQARPEVLQTRIEPG